MTKYARESYGMVVKEIKPLLKKHWQEIARFKDIALDPNWEGYFGADRAGALRIYTARTDIGTLIGYGIFFKGHLHYKGSFISTQDIFFVLPEHRGIVGARLLQFCDAQLKAEGAQAVYQHVKKAHDFGPMLQRMGYEPVETVWVRRF